MAVVVIVTIEAWPYRDGGVIERVTKRVSGKETEELTHKGLTGPWKRSREILNENLEILVLFATRMVW